MTQRADFSRVLIGLEPVIQAPPVLELVEWGPWQFYEEPVAGAERATLWVPMPDPVIEWPRMHEIAGNPVRPPWQGWPDWVEPVPFPAEHRMVLNWVHWAIEGLEDIEGTVSGLTSWTSQVPLDWSFSGTVSLGILPSIWVEGDDQSQVPADTIETLVELARQDRYEDFVALAGAVGVAKAEWDELWRGTRLRTSPAKNLRGEG